MAAKKSKKPKKAKGGDGEASRQDQNQSYKQFLILLVVLNVIAGGLYGYLRLVRADDALKAQRQAENQLARLKSQAMTVQQAATEIVNGQIKEVAEPGELVATIAQANGIGPLISVKNTTAPRTWNKSAIHAERRVGFTFKEKEGFKLKDLHRFFADLERANSKVQITRFNIPQRDPPRANGDVFWRPTDAELRVFVQRRR